jgi:hypothetical protein
LQTKNAKLVRFGEPGMENVGIIYATLDYPFGVL